MGVLEIVLLAAGAVIFLASFCIPVRQEKLHEETKKLAEGEVKVLVSEELENIRSHLSELSEEEMQQQIEKSERTMERISNEKIMAVNEYSDTVLDEIHKNHEEVVFLYDILKDKKEKMKETFSETDTKLKDLLQQIKDSEITVREKLDKLEEKQKDLERGLTTGAKEAIPYPEEVPERVAAPVDSLPVERVKAPVKSAGRKKEGTAVKSTGRKKEGTSVKSAGVEKTETPDIPEKQENTEALSFQPFQPEKVEVVPKKTRTGKRAPKKQVKEAQVPQQQEPVRQEELLRAESGDRELLLSSGTDWIKNSNERILELHKAGKSNMAIARELGLGIGEVKLVIDLYEGL